MKTETIRPFSYIGKLAMILYVRDEVMLLVSPIRMTDKRS